MAKVEAKEKSGLPKHPVADLVVSGLFTAWLLAFPYYPFLLFGPSVWALNAMSLGLAPVWRMFYWAIVALNVLQLIFKVIALARIAPAWRRVMKIIEQLLGFSILMLLLQVQEYIVFGAAGPKLSSPQDVARLNMGIHRGLEVVATIAGLKLAWDVIQLVVQSRRDSAIGHRATKSI